MPIKDKNLSFVLLALLLAFLPSAFANSDEVKINLLTQNFPPFSMAIDGKNFASVPSG